MLQLSHLFYILRTQYPSFRILSNKSVFYDLVALLHVHSLSYKQKSIIHFNGTLSLLIPTVYNRLLSIFRFRFALLFSIRSSSACASKCLRVTIYYKMIFIDRVCSILI